MIHATTRARYLAHHTQHFSLSTPYSQPKRHVGGVRSVRLKQLNALSAPIEFDAVILQGAGEFLVCNRMFNDLLCWPLSKTLGFPVDSYVCHPLKWVSWAPNQRLSQRTIPDDLSQRGKNRSTPKSGPTDWAPRARPLSDSSNWAWAVTGGTHWICAIEV